VGISDGSSILLSTWATALLQDLVHNGFWAGCSVGVCWVVRFEWPIYLMHGPIDSRHGQLGLLARAQPIRVFQVSLPVCFFLLASRLS